jgi:hypothetical protein
MRYGLAEEDRCRAVLFPELHEDLAAVFVDAADHVAQVSRLGHEAPAARGRVIAAIRSFAATDAKAA